MTTVTLEVPVRSTEKQPSYRIEGGLLGPDILERIKAGEGRGQSPTDLSVPAGRSLTDWVAEQYRDARALWQIFQRRLERSGPESPATVETRSWMTVFLELLGYSPHRNECPYQIEGTTYPVSHRADEDPESPPVHIVGARQELGRLDPRSRRRLSPHGLLQEFLNRSEHTWGLVSNGLVLRLLRKSTAVRLQTYLEFDLKAILEGERFTDFLFLYRTLHRSRLPQRAGETCLLDEYHRESEEQGTRARDRLRDGVEEALRHLGTALLRHPKNRVFRETITPQALYEQLLRLIYRFLFLLVVEDRGILGGNDLYRDHYGITRLRRLVDRREAPTDHEDLWLSLKTLWHLLRDPRPVPQAGNQPLAHLLGIPVLDGDLFACLEIEKCAMTNRDLLEAFRHLSYYYDDEARTFRRVNYAALDVEELGSVYESLLENHPQVVAGAGGPEFHFAEGTERKSTGSYYTPRELVAELVRSALEPLLAERLNGARAKEEKEQAILSIRVLDPACGSGHFLLAATRRLGLELARVRTGEEEPGPEALREAVRDVIAHCIYGVDKNPLAVELCKVALWIEAQVPGKPLTFLDHRIRLGDSLVGVADFKVLEEGIPDAAYDARSAEDRAVARRLRDRNRAERRQHTFLSYNIPQTLERLAQKWREVAELSEETVQDLQRKAQRYEVLRGEPEWTVLKTACDLWTAAFFLDPSRFPVPTTDDVWAVLRGNPRDAHMIGTATAEAERLRFFHWPLEFPEVFEDGGFDVVLSNPPFMGGLKISGTFGPHYRHWLEYAFAPFGGTADLCAAFYRRAFNLLRPGGRLGMVATNTIGQGDTRESGLAPIIRGGGTITFARRFIKWPGAANVEVNLVAIHKPDHSPSAIHHSQFAIRHSPILDGHPVPFISSRLDPEPEAEPRRLPQNEGKAFIGDYVRGIGFVLEPEEAEALLAKDPRNRDCLFPYLNGEDLNSHPEQKPSRWVICFHDWPLERARQYLDLLRIVEERVKPEREKLRDDVSGYRRLKEKWWLYAAYAQGMRQAIAPLRRVLVRSRVSEMHALTFVPQGWIYNEQLVVFAFDDDYHFALLQSSVHEVWLRKQASSLRTDVRYTPTDCFDTFPFPPEEYRRIANGEWRTEALPEPFRRAAQVGAEYHEHRRQIMLARNIGLTKAYNLFHDPNCTDPDIIRLRELHIELDRAVLACYGWSDLDLQHDFHPNERDQIRFTVSTTARRILLHRLLQLNLQLAQEESTEAG